MANFCFPSSMLSSKLIAIKYKPQCGWWLKWKGCCRHAFQGQEKKRLLAPPPPMILTFFQVCREKKLYIQGLTLWKIRIYIHLMINLSCGEKKLTTYHISLACYRKLTFFWPIFFTLTCDVYIQKYICFAIWSLLILYTAFHDLSSQSVWETVAPWKLYLCMFVCPDFTAYI